MKTLGVIPARYAAQRFPGKPLVLIAGKPLVQRVYEQARQAQRLDRVVVATDDARIADNAGAQPVDAPVVARGPTAYWSTLPIKAIVATLRAHEIPAAVSQTAGTFVCNHVFYSLMHALRARRGVRGGFIHVPFLPEQAKQGQPSLPQKVMIEAIALAVAVSVRTRRDRREAGGQIH